MMSSRRRSKPPSVTVVIATFNAERFIDSALQSILGQTRAPDEVIVLDDGSSDGTREILQQHRRGVRLLTQDNQGIARSYNRLFHEARGDYVALGSHDDIWEAEKLEWQMETIARYPNVDVAFGHARIFEGADEEFDRPPSRGLISSADLLRALFVRNLICAPTALIRRDLHRQLNGFREDIPAEDYEFWLRALRASASFFYDPRLLVRYRRHARNESSKLEGMYRMNYAVHLLHVDALSDRRWARKVLARDLRRLGGHLRAEGSFSAASSAYLNSLRHSVGLRPAAAAALCFLLARRPGSRPAATGMQSRLGGRQG